MTRQTYPERDRETRVDNNQKLTVGDAETESETGRQRCEQ